MDYAVIMAGGSGKRLWPLSRRERPKQVLKLFGGKTLLESCFERLAPLFDPSRIFVLTNKAYVDLVRENLQGLPAENVVAEPAVRDTAGAVGLGATILSKLDPDATMAVVTADQVIRPASVFQQAMKEALGFVNQYPDRLVTFGIKPTFAATQYGYIKCAVDRASTFGSAQIFPVEAFKEKPDEVTAQAYLREGLYDWNSGMFVWKAKTILAHIRDLLPEAVKPLERIKRAWGTPEQETVFTECFARLPRISVDYAVMEKASEVYAIRLACDWLDMGSFSALADIVTCDEYQNTVVAQTKAFLDCEDNIIVTEQSGHLIAAIGLKNMVVAHSPDATLICPMNEIHRLKELLEKIEQAGQDGYL